MTYYSDIQKKKNHKPPITGSNSKTKIKDIYIIRFLSSMFLLIIVYLVFYMNHPIAIKVQDFIRESMTREYNFSGIYNIYKEKFAGNPAILPTLVKKDKNELSESNFIPPFHNSPKTVKQIEQGVILELNNENKIVAIGEGIIINIDNNKTVGNYVQIRHQNGLFVTYAMLEEVNVEVNEWVETGQTIGLVNNKLFLSMFNQNEYLNPLEVISFD